MPAASDLPTALSLPHVFRPLGVRLAVYVLGLLLFGTTSVIWFAFPQETRDDFTVFQRLTVVLFGVGIAAAGHALARSRIIATDDRVTVVNGYKVRHYDWNEILAITLGGGSPWAVLDLSDGTSASAMGIQGSDGVRAKRQVRQVRRLIAAKSRTDRDD